MYNRKVDHESILEISLFIKASGQLKHCKFSNLYDAKTSASCPHAEVMGFMTVSLPFVVMKLV